MNDLQLTEPLSDAFEFELSHDVSAFPSLNRARTSAGAGRDHARLKRVVRTYCSGAASSDHS